MSASKKVTHVIFDIDGLLLDTEKVYDQCADVVCAKYGKKQNWDLIQQIQGVPEEEDAKLTIDELQLPLTVEEYLKMTWGLQEQLFPHTKLLPGVERFVRHLHKHRVPIGLATGSSEKKYDVKITNHKELFNLFHHVVFSSGDPEVKHSKPAPDVFLVSASRFPDNPDPSKVLVFEDAVNGVQGALSAGMHCVWIPDQRADKSLFQDKVTVLNSMEEFQPEMYGLPPYDD